MKKSHYIIGGVIISIGLIYFFAPPLVDFSGQGSRFNQWKNRNVPLKTTAGGKLEYAANSDNPTIKKPIASSF